MQKLPEIPSQQKSKDLVVLFIAIAIIVLIIVFGKHLTKIFGGLFSTVEGAGQGIGEALGITESKDDKTVKSAKDATVPSPLYSYSFKQYYQPKAPAGAPLMTVSNIHTLIEQLKDSKSFFNFGDDTAKAIGVFSKMPTKIIVSWFAERFNSETGNDLFDWLTHYYKSDVVASIVKNVNAKPTFKV